MFLHFRYYREYIGLSLRAFAEQLEISNSNLSYKERGEQSYTLVQAARSAQILGVPLHRLVEFPVHTVTGWQDIPPPPRTNLITVPLRLPH